MSYTLKESLSPIQNSIFPNILQGQTDYKSNSCYLFLLTTNCTGLWWHLMRKNNFQSFSWVFTCLSWSRFTGKHYFLFRKRLGFCTVHWIVIFSVAMAVPWRLWWGFGKCLRKRNCCSLFHSAVTGHCSLMTVEMEWDLLFYYQRVIIFHFERQKP